MSTTVVHETLALNAVHEFSNPGTADLVCTSTAAATANRSRITAIKVATLTASG